MTRKSWDRGKPTGLGDRRCEFYSFSRTLLSHANSLQIGSIVQDTEVGSKQLCDSSPQDTPYHDHVLGRMTGVL